MPLFEQSPLTGSVFTQRFLRSLPPELTGEQVPTFPLTLQLRQSPCVPEVASEQAVSQQTPSVQFPDWHSPPPAHDVPLAFLPQELLIQVLPPVQSALLVHVLLHAPPLQMNVPQLTAPGVLHWPAPLHLDTPVADDVVGQLASLQVLVLSQFAHAPALHRPV